MLPAAASDEPADYQAFALLRLASPALPIGAFSYSQGLEIAVARGWITDETGLRDWLLDLTHLGLANYEAPLVWQAAAAAARGDLERLDHLDADFLATRETAELLAETTQMGFSLLRLLTGLDDASERRAIAHARRRLAADTPCSLPCAWALAADAFGVTASGALQAWLWSWLENQVAAAIKSVPLGQQAGQRVLEALQPRLAQVAREAGARDPDDWHAFAPVFAMASAHHERQYSRLFRS